VDRAQEYIGELPLGGDSGVLNLLPPGVTPEDVENMDPVERALLQNRAQHGLMNGWWPNMLPPASTPPPPSSPPDLVTRNISAGHEGIQDYPEEPLDIRETPQPESRKNIPIETRNISAGHESIEVPPEPLDIIEGGRPPVIPPQPAIPQPVTPSPEPAGLGGVPAVPYRQRHQGLGLDMDYLMRADPNAAMQYMYQVAQQRENPQLTWRQRQNGATEPLMPNDFQMFNQMMQTYTGQKMVEPTIAGAEADTRLTQARARTEESAANVAERTEDTAVQQAENTMLLTGEQVRGAKWQNDWNDKTEDQQIEQLELNLKLLRNDPRLSDRYSELVLDGLEADNRLALAQALAVENDGSMNRIIMMDPSAYLAAARADTNLLQDFIVEERQRITAMTQAAKNASGSVKKVIEDQILEATVRLAFLSDPGSMSNLTYEDYLVNTLDNRAARKYQEAVAAGNEEEKKKWLERMQGDIDLSEEQFNAARDAAATIWDYNNRTNSYLTGGVSGEGSGGADTQTQRDLQELNEHFSN
jgi:hypothetical protein